jgi:hypothetical protein
VQDFIGHADPQEQPALLADWRDLAQGQREHVFWKSTPALERRPRGRT